MPKVLHITRSWLPQTETWIANQILNTPFDFASAVFCETLENLDQFPFDEIYCLKRDSRFRYYAEKAASRYGLTRGLPSAQKASANARPDIVHSHFGPKGWENSGWTRRNSVPHVVSFYGYDVGYIPQSSPKWRGRYAQMFEETSLFLCEGPFMKDSIAALGCDPAKIMVQHLGIDPDVIEYRPRHWQPGETLKVLIAASFLEKKGIPYAIEALGRLKDDLPIEVTLVGDSNHTRGGDEEKRRILDAVERSGLRDRITMPGYIRYKDLLQMSFDHHIFLLPSVHARDGDCEGGCPVVLIEMAASGAMIAATRHCDVPEVIEDGVSGRLAAERDAKDLYEQLLKLVSEAARWPEMALAARSRIEVEFDSRRLGAALGNIYRGLLTP